jgi:hypothetical protein
MEAKLPTAEEFLIYKGVANPIGEIWRLDLSRDCYAQTEKDIHTAMIEFAKLHVEAALKEATKCLPYDDKMNRSLLDERAILNSYPPEKIK